MAVLKLCDGCDKTEKSGILTDDWERLTIEIRGGKYQLDLCESCANTFVDRHLPIKWPRLRGKKVS